MNNPYTMKNHLLHIQLALLFALPLAAHAEAASSSPAIQEITATTTAATSTATSTPEQLFTQCQQQAIEDRDTQIASSRTLYNTAMANALTDRKNKEKLAIAIIDKDAKKVAIKNSVDTYKNLVKKAQNDLTEARKDAWETFEDTIQACRETQNDALENAEATSTEATVEDSGVGSIQNVINVIKSLFDK